MIYSRLATNIQYEKADYKNLAEKNPRKKQKRIIGQTEKISLQETQCYGLIEMCTSLLAQALVSEELKMLSKEFIFTAPTPKNSTIQFKHTSLLSNDAH